MNYPKEKGVFVIALLISFFISCGPSRPLVNLNPKNEVHAENMPVIGIIGNNSGMLNKPGFNDLQSDTVIIQSQPPSLRSLTKTVKDNRVILDSINQNANDSKEIKAMLGVIIKSNQDMSQAIKIALTKADSAEKRADRAEQLRIEERREFEAKENISDTGLFIVNYFPFIVGLVSIVIGIIFFFIGRYSVKKSFTL